MVLCGHMRLSVRTAFYAGDRSLRVRAVIFTSRRRSIFFRLSVLSQQCGNILVRLGLTKLCCAESFTFPRFRLTSRTPRFAGVRRH